MSFFNWLWGKSQQHQPDAGGHKTAPKSEASQRVADKSRNDNTGRIKRHLRRDQLYVAIREAMTRAGVLSSGYKFKVLSLDARGDEFFVMMDLAYVKSAQDFVQMEALILQNAKSRFDIAVRAVYWRPEEIAGVTRPAPLRPSAVSAEVDTKPAALPQPLPAFEPRYEPIQADEVAAFKQALLAASAHAPLAAAAAAASASPPPPAKQSAKLRTGQHSYTLLTGFEDTELPESPALPALSATQYGDLS